MFGPCGDDAPCFIGHGGDSYHNETWHENVQLRRALSATAAALHVALHGHEEAPDVVAGCEVALVHADNVLGKDHCTC